MASKNERMHLTNRQIHALITVLLSSLILPMIPPKIMHTIKEFMPEVYTWIMLSRKDGYFNSYTTGSTVPAFPYVS